MKQPLKESIILKTHPIEVSGTWQSWRVFWISSAVTILDSQEFEQSIVCSTVIQSLYLELNENVHALVHAFLPTLKLGLLVLLIGNIYLNKAPSDWSSHRY